MATRQEKDTRFICFWVGFVVGFFVLCGISALSSRQDASTYLNNKKYVIDTTMIVHHQDTTYKYQFIKK